jgi:hypothetical protein
MPHLAQLRVRSLMRPSMWNIHPCTVLRLLRARRRGRFAVPRFIRYRLRSLVAESEAVLQLPARQMRPS